MWLTEFSRAETMEMTSSILIAILALGAGGGVAASIDKGRFMRMTPSEYDLMVRDGHDAWQRSVCRPEMSGGPQSRFYLVRQCDGPEQAALSSLGGRNSKALGIPTEGTSD
jgi:hypothetical protein